MAGAHSTPGCDLTQEVGSISGTAQDASQGELWVRGLEASSAPFEAVEDAELLGGHREVMNLHHPASWVASHPRAGPDISEDQRRAISTSAVCRVRSCHARAHCTARSKGLAITPKNEY